jgi:hypothetical protein
MTTQGSDLTSKEELGGGQGKILPFKKPKKVYSKGSYDGWMYSLRTRQTTAQPKWLPFKPSGDSPWQRFKAGVEYAWSDLKQAFDEASAIFK